MEVQANKSSSCSLLHSAAFSCFGTVVVVAYESYECASLSSFLQEAEADEAAQKMLVSNSHPIGNVERKYSTPTNFIVMIPRKTETAGSA